MASSGGCAPSWRAAVTTLGALAFALATACGKPAPPRDPGACPQTYEFGNFGCAEIVGRVVNREGRGLPLVSVGPRYLATALDGARYNTYQVDTDTLGRFRFRVTRFEQRREVTEPDTFSLFVRAAVRPLVTGASPAAIDSVLVRVEVAPPGRIPTPTEVEMRLRYP